MFRSPISLALLLALSPWSVSAVQAACAGNTGDLFALGLEDLAQVRVYAPARRAQTLPNAPGVVSVMSRDDIARFGAADVPDLLQRLPAVFPYGSSFLRDNIADVRAQHSGTSNRHVLVLLNGFPLRDSVFGGSDRPLFQGLPIESIERIEYIRGPGSVVYGSNAMSGVINIVTRHEARARSGGFTLAAGSHGGEQMRASASIGSPSSGLDVHVRRSRHDGWPFAAYDRVGVYKKVDFAEQDDSLLLTGDWLGINMQAFVADADFTGFGAVPLWPQTDLGQQLRHYALSRNFELSPCWSLEVSALEHGYGLNAVRGQARDGERGPPETQRVDSDMRHVELVLRGETDSMHWLFGTSFSQLRATQIVLPVQPQAKHLSDDWRSVYAQMDMPITEQTQVIVGVAQYSDDSGGEDPVARLTLVHQFNPVYGIKFNVGDAYRAPYLQETLGDVPGVVRGNPDLKPETNRSVELQFFGRSVDWAFAATLFHTRYEDIIAFVPVSGSTALQAANIDTLEVEGGELEAEYGLSALRVLGSISYQENINAAGTSDTQLSPNLMAKLGVSWRSEADIDISLFNTWFGEPGRRQAPPRNPQAKAYHHLTLQVSAPLSHLAPSLADHDWRVTLFADNALENDAVYYPDPGRPDVNTLPQRPGRRWWLQLGARF